MIFNLFWKKLTKADALKINQ